MSDERAFDMVNHPPHYKTASGLEAIDVIEAFGLDRSFCLGNAMKYLLRAGKKGSRLEDLKKAAWYLGREIANTAPGATTDGRAVPEREASVRQPAGVPEGPTPGQEAVGCG